MRPPFFVCMALAVATALLALGTASANSGGTTQPRLATPSASAGKVTVRYMIKRFASRGGGLVAYGTAIARYVPGSAGGEISTATKPFQAAVGIRSAGTRRLAAAQTICPVLSLDLEQLDLDLAGLLVHADRVFLTLQADSTGGTLGSLLCGLATSGKLTKQTPRLNWTVQKSGLAASGTGFTVGLQPATSAGGGSSAGGNSAPSAITPLTLCPVLALTLGPLDANLLGLLVHLDQVHLTITADSTGGILGSAFCTAIGSGGATS